MFLHSTHKSPLWWNIKLLHIDWRRKKVKEVEPKIHIKHTNLQGKWQKRPHSSNKIKTNNNNKKQQQQRRRRRRKDGNFYSCKASQFCSDKINIIWSDLIPPVVAATKEMFWFKVHVLVLSATGRSVCSCKCPLCSDTYLQQQLSDCISDRQCYFSGCHVKYFFCVCLCVCASRFGLTVWLYGSPCSSKVVVYGHCLVTDFAPRKVFLSANV